VADSHATSNSAISDVNGKKPIKTESHSIVTFKNFICYNCNISEKFKTVSMCLLKGAALC